MKKTAIALVAMTALTACGTPTDAAYGSDPALDALYDECADGAAAACDDLFWDSPSGSAYESFALERGGGDTSGADVEADAVEQGYEAAVSMLPDMLQANPDICEAFILLGEEAAVEAFMEGFGEAEFDSSGVIPESRVRADVTAALREGCAS